MLNPRPARRATSCYRVLLEFADWVTDDDLVSDLSQSPAHRMHEHQPRVSHASDGRTHLALTVAGGDVWSCTLTAMALVRQSGYEPTAVHVAAQEPGRAA